MWFIRTMHWTIALIAILFHNGASAELEETCLSNDPSCVSNVAEVDTEKAELRAAALRMLSAYIGSRPETLIVDKTENPAGHAERAEFLDEVINDAHKLIGYDTFSDDELNEILVEATRAAATASRNTGGTKFLDRYLKGLLGTIEDPDCMEREFDLQNKDFDPTEAIGVFKKCKLLVLRNVFDKDFLMGYRKNFTNYVHAIHTDQINPSGSTSNGESYYLHEIDNKRWEVILPKEFAHPDLLANSNVMDILMDDNILGNQLALHSLGTALAEPGANGQQWHKDAEYIFSDSSIKTHGVGGHDLPSYSTTMMIPLVPNMTHAHGPTEFCMGSSWIDGVAQIVKAPLLDKSLLENLTDWIELYDTERPACPPRFWRMPLLKFGDMLLFDYQITHRGGQNISPDLRAVMYMTYSRTWYKDQNFNRNEEEIADKLEMLDMQQRRGTSDNLSKEAMQEHFDRQRQEALLEQLTATARFAEPDGHNCVGSSNSIEDCWSGAATVELESLPTFLPAEMGSIPIKMRTHSVTEKFLVSNFDVHAVGGVQIIRVGKKAEKIGVLAAGEYMNVEAWEGALIEARVKGGKTIKSWTVLPEQVQLVISVANTADA